MTRHEWIVIACAVRTAPFAVSQHTLSEAKQRRAVAEHMADSLAQFKGFNREAFLFECIAWDPKAGYHGHEAAARA